MTCTVSDKLLADVRPNTKSLACGFSTALQCRTFLETHAPEHDVFYQTGRWP
jgi:hypothetical protein